MVFDLSEAVWCWYCAVSNFTTTDPILLKMKALHWTHACKLVRPWPYQSLINICFVLNMRCICYGNFMVVCCMTIGLNEDSARYLGELKVSGSNKNNYVALKSRISVVSIGWTSVVGLGIRPISTVRNETFWRLFSYIKQFAYLESQQWEIFHHRSKIRRSNIPRYFKTFVLFFPYNFCKLLM